MVTSNDQFENYMKLQSNLIIQDYLNSTTATATEEDRKIERLGLSFTERVIMLMISKQEYFCVTSSKCETSKCCTEGNLTNYIEMSDGMSNQTNLLSRIAS